MMPETKRVQLTGIAGDPDVQSIGSASLMVRCDYVGTEVYVMARRSDEDQEDQSYMFMALDVATAEWLVNQLQAAVASVSREP
jgi:hypothetical protein